MQSIGDVIGEVAPTRALPRNLHKTFKTKLSDRHLQEDLVWHPHEEANGSSLEFVVLCTSVVGGDKEDRLAQFARKSNEGCFCHGGDDLDDNGCEVGNVVVYVVLSIESIAQAFMFCTAPLFHPIPASGAQSHCFARSGKYRTGFYALQIAFT